MIFDAAQPIKPTLWPYGVIACGFYFGLDMLAGSAPRPE